MLFTGLMLSLALMFQGVDDTGVAVARPTGEVYLEPTTGSYFQIFEFYGRPPHTWRHAQRMVRGYRYEGREGQLASVKTGKTHYFLLTKFPLLQKQRMWIGLQAVCNETVDITWTDGDDLADQSFRAWNDGTQKRISRTCRARRGSGLQLPVYYDPNLLGTRWEVGTIGTNIQYMMVEFVEPIEEEVEEKPAATP